MSYVAATAGVTTSYIASVAVATTYVIANNLSVAATAGVAADGGKTICAMVG